MRSIACEGQPLKVFFEDSWPPYRHDAGSYHENLAHARSFCDTCPARTACLAMECEAEQGETADYRAGIFGGFTPQQRLSLHKRGVPLKCPECTLKYDPVELRNGILRCDCGTKRMTPIPDRGDQWLPRHTKLARMTVRWLMDNVELGGEVPDALALSRQLKVGVKDLRRVYQALAEDAVIRRDNGKLVLCDATVSEFNWKPPHLRSSQSVC